MEEGAHAEESIPHNDTEFAGEEDLGLGSKISPQDGTMALAILIVTIIAVVIAGYYMLNNKNLDNSDK